MPLNRKARLGLAIIVAALMVWGLSSFLRSLGDNRPPARNTAQNTASPPGATVSSNTGRLVAYAREAIPERSILTGDMFEMRAVEGEQSNIDYISNPTQVAGYVTRVPIPRDSPLHGADLLGHISDVGIAGAISPGLRAIVVPIANKPTLHDLVRIGDNVDVIANFDGQEGRAIVQNVRVLAVDVFGKDFPQVSVAMRGSYKAQPSDVRVANPASPGAASPTVRADSATPTPTPVAASAQAAARPDPAITLEVTPAQATAISLAQAANAILDLVLRPRSEAVPVAGAIVPAGVTRAQLAPYAERLKSARSTTGRTSAGATREVSTAARGAAQSERAASGRRLRNYSDEAMPTFPRPENAVPPSAPVSGPNLPPAVPQTPQTYNIPVYADGKTVRVETVRKPVD